MEWSEVEGRPLVVQSGNNTDGFNVNNSQRTLHPKQDKEKHLGKTNSFRFIIESFCWSGFLRFQLRKKPSFFSVLLFKWVTFTFGFCSGHLCMFLLSFKSKTLLNFQIKDRPILSK